MVVDVVVVGATVVDVVVVVDVRFGNLANAKVPNDPEGDPTLPLTGRMGLQAVSTSNSVAAAMNRVWFRVIHGVSTTTGATFRSFGLFLDFSDALSGVHDRYLSI